MGSNRDTTPHDGAQDDLATVRRVVLVLSIPEALCAAVLIVCGLVFTFSPIIGACAAAWAAR